MCGQIGATFSIMDASIRAEVSFFSVASTTPLVAGPRQEMLHYLSYMARNHNSPLMPKDVVPPATAARACSIWTSFPEGEKVVREKEYAPPPPGADMFAKEKG